MMGCGDEIMVSGEARLLFKKYGKPVLVTGIGDAPRYSGLWYGLDYIIDPSTIGDINYGDVTILKNGPRCRPYISNKTTWTKESGIQFTQWRARDCVGELVFRPDEISFAYNNVPFGKPFVLIEPNIQSESNPNKQWPFHKWQEIVNSLPQFTFVQVGDAMQTKVLQGVHFIKCPSFRYAAAIVNAATVCILPEGGLHHAAGVLKRPAVVLFGGFISPSTTGYPWHVNIADIGDKSPCGKWVKCDHCKQIWSSLAPSRVIRKFKLLCEGILP